MNYSTQQTPNNDVAMKRDDISISDNTTSASYGASPISQQTSESSQYDQKAAHSQMDCDHIKNDNHNDVQQEQSSDDDQPLYDPKDTMNRYGCIPLREMCKTLQGTVWKVWHKRRECEAIVKITNKTLAAKHIGINHKSGQYFICKESIEQEINMLYALNRNKSTVSPAMVDLYQVFQDEFNIFVVMEHGGSKLLDFVNRAHRSITNGKMLLREWKNTAKIMMKQIVEFVDWLHNVHHVCHLDISLENLLISNVEWKYDDKTYSVAPTFQIKFVDFGLAEKFTETVPKNVDMHNPESDDSDAHNECASDTEYESGDGDAVEQDVCKISFECNKFSGKVKYECPRVYNKEIFDARRADIWSVGVCWFMICIGFDPWKVPDGKQDDCYHIMVNQHRLSDVLAYWKRTKYLDKDGRDLFYVLFSEYMYRVSTRELLSHPWMK